MIKPAYKSPWKYFPFTRAKSRTRRMSFFVDSLASPSFYQHDKVFIWKLHLLLENMMILPAASITDITQMKPDFKNEGALINSCVVQMFRYYVQVSISDFLQCLNFIVWCCYWKMRNIRNMKIKTIVFFAWSCAGIFRKQRAAGDVTCDDVSDVFFKRTCSSGISSLKPNHSWLKRNWFLIPLSHLTVTECFENTEETKLWLYERRQINADQFPFFLHNWYCNKTYILEAQTFL